MSTIETILWLSVPILFFAAVRWQAGDFGKKRKPSEGDES